MACVLLPIRWMHMRKRVLPEAAAHIKSSAAARDLVLRRIDLQNDGLSALAQQAERPLAITAVPFFREDAEMLHIDVVLCLPVQQQTDPVFAVIDQLEMICLILQNGHLRGILPLLMQRKALAVQPHRVRQPRVIRCGQSFKMHRSPPSFPASKSSRPPMAPVPFKDGSHMLPCYHLVLRRPRGRTPQQVRITYPSSPITAGQRRRSLAERFGAALRGHFPPRPPRFAPTVRNSLCRTSPRTFLFIAFAI